MAAAAAPAAAAVGVVVVVVVMVIVIVAIAVVVVVVVSVVPQEMVQTVVLLGKFWDIYDPWVHLPNECCGICGYKTDRDRTYTDQCLGIQVAARTRRPILIIINVKNTSPQRDLQERASCY